MGLAGKVRRLPWPRNHPCLFFSYSSVCPCLAAPFLSVDFLVFCSSLSPSRRCLANMLPASFASNTESSPASGLECLRRNITAIGSTLPPPVAGSSLGCASVLAQGMGQGLLLKFAGQASGKWSVCLLRFLIVANAFGLWGGFGGTPLPWHAQGSLEVTIKREGGGLIGINS